MKLSNKTILITGGSAGIGLTLAKEFLALDNRVIICGRSRTKLEEAKQLNPKLHIVECDVSNEESLRSMVRHVTREFPKLDVVIYNAGVMLEYDFDTDPNTLNKIDLEVNTNLIAPAKLISLLLPNLKKAEKAAIINISSAMAFVPAKGTPLYCGSKMALHYFTNSLRRQLEHTTIRVFEVFPPSVATEMTAHQNVPKITPEKFVKKMIKGLRRDKYQNRIGQAKILYILSRIAPNLIEALFAKISDSMSRKAN